MEGFSGIAEELSLIIDLIFIRIAFLLTVSLYESKGVHLNEDWALYTLLFFGYVILWILLSNIMAVYQSRHFISWKREFRLLSEVHAIALAGVLVILNLARPGMIKNRFTFYFVFIAFVLTLLGHLAMRLYWQVIRRKGDNFRYILLLGGGRAAENYISKLENNPQLGYKPIGYLAPQKNGLKLSYLGQYSDLEKVVGDNIVDMVVVVDSIASRQVERAIDLLEVMGKQVVVLMGETISLVAHSRSVDFDGLPMVSLDFNHRNPWGIVGKRLLDISASGITLIILSPLFLIVGIAIKLSSKGPVFFSQERVGLNGRRFKMYKFRSMVFNAEELKSSLSDLNEMSGPVFKIRNDPRVTMFGRFLRKTSIDELPQLWNVLIGDMSLVGPRPPLPEEVDLYNLKHRKRLAVRPGLTCIWQISGRNAVDFEEWMKMDNDYVSHWSMKLDLQILFKTVPAVLMRRGAS